MCAGGFVIRVWCRARMANREHEAVALEDVATAGPASEVVEYGDREQRDSSQAHTPRPPPSTCCGRICEWIQEMDDEAYTIFKKYFFCVLMVVAFIPYPFIWYFLIYPRFMYRMEHPPPGEENDPGTIMIAQVTLALGAGFLYMLVTVLFFSVVSSLPAMCSRPGQALSRNLCEGWDCCLRVCCGVNHQPLQVV